MANINAVFLVMLVAGYFAALVYLENNHGKRAYISNDEYLSSLAMVRRCSVYDLFHCSGVDWKFSNSKIEADFSGILTPGMPAVQARTRSRPNMSMAAWIVSAPEPLSCILAPTNCVIASPVSHSSGPPVPTTTLQNTGAWLLARRADNMAR